jgi:hypothetical protein
MCPEYERVRRIVEQDVKAPECTPETEHLPRKDRIPDESRMVKAYARSAAGMDIELVSEIRSPATCVVCRKVLTNGRVLTPVENPRIPLRSPRPR